MQGLQISIPVGEVSKKALEKGLILITAVMMIPQLSGIFKVQTLTWNQLWIVYGLALLNLPVIQLIKWIWKWKKD